ncbi:MAG TPA: lamin tail domain-containing protein [Polyangiaceae bacterium]|jgi:hypothetical protein|nr:MAG: hypothetical protein BWY17_04693 [Deltaproteobacteria bacterium ADurb.Bin207]HNS95889.1 lamin tail domain-containing protein [Polyangiaceae bacterium]HNZ24549.1 lamin tail domain-containing protein [Polyangiaceae bacterium]HOD21965.1 lamin tail domain-containing protein [Polyangiaceae bacterium]HOE47931.1 lamin tail domain-containing protein [Polyangiaceae bacterium]
MLLLGCGDLAQAPQRANTSSRGEPKVDCIPDIESDGKIAPIVQFRVRNLNDAPKSPPRLVEGKLSERNLRDLRQGNPSEALQKRIIESITWTIEGQWYLSAERPLSLGGVYSLVVPETGWHKPWEVIERDEIPTLRRVWPPEQRAGMTAVWCLTWPALELAPSEPQHLQFPPGIDGTLQGGAVDGVGVGCSQWTAHVGGAVVVPAPLIWWQQSWVRLDPTPLSLQQFEENWQASCPSGQTPLGPVCAVISDNKAILGAKEPWLVGLTLPDFVQADAVGAARPWTVKPLPPSSEIRGQARIMSVSGQVRNYEVHWKTAEPCARVVINEVMANPVGPEPQQEWVELFNDGSQAINLQGWRLEDAGGGVELPAVTLQPGQFGLIVGQGYDPASWVDAAPAEHTVFLPVTSVGIAGLSNAGEPLRLVDHEGQAVSFVPPIASKRPGGSIIRLRPEAPDIPASFAVDLQGGTPGAPNRIPNPSENFP